MHRRNMLAVFALLVAPAPCFAQYGGMGGMGGGMGGMGGGMAQGGMGMGGMGMGMGRMGMMGSQRRAIERAVEVEMEDGKKIKGAIQLDSMLVESDVGRYQIKPDHVKALRLSDPGRSTRTEGGMQVIEGVVITTTDKDIKGKVQCPAWRLDLEFGTLTLDPSKVRTMTFTAPAEPKEGKKEPLSQAQSSPVSVTLIEGPNVVALMVSGKKITRLAAATQATGDWIPINLREPVEGQAIPIVGPGIVVYGLGRHVYAFGPEANRWDVLDLPKGAGASPIVGNQSARVEYDGQIHMFSAKTGKWTHIDTHALLDAVHNP